MENIAVLEGYNYKQPGSFGRAFGAAFGQTFGAAFGTAFGVDCGETACRPDLAPCRPDLAPCSQPLSPCAPGLPCCGGTQAQPLPIPQVTTDLVVQTPVVQPPAQVEVNAAVIVPATPAEVAVAEEPGKPTDMGIQGLGAAPPSIAQARLRQFRAGFEWANMVARGYGLFANGGPEEALRRRAGGLSPRQLTAYATRLRTGRAAYTEGAMACLADIEWAVRGTSAAHIHLHVLGVIESALPARMNSLDAGSLRGLRGLRRRGN